MIELPLGLTTALESGHCVLFVGAGIGAHLHDEDGNPAPDGETLAQELANHFGVDTEGNNDLAKVSQIIDGRKKRKELMAFLSDRLSNLQPDEHLQWLFSLKWGAIYTTNYDNGIQRTYEIIENPKQNCLTITTTAGIASYNSTFQVPIYHLHGALFGTKKSEIVITETDYSFFKKYRAMLFERLRYDFVTSNILYVGYSNRDPNWKMLLDEIRTEYTHSPMPQSYRIDQETKLMDIEILKSNNIETITCSIADFIDTASIALSDVAVSTDHIDRIESSIPTDLLSSFRENPAPVVRLLSSWTYVNQASFNATANVSQFLRGDRANWGLVGEGEYFERDIEEQAYEDLLDYATIGTQSVRINVLLGSAGYGVTTLLMALAAKLVREKAGPVFMLRPGQAPAEGDVNFALSLFDEKPFFIIDNAADYNEVIHSTIHRLKEAKKSAMLLVGERLNEWRQGHGKLTGKEFLIEPLSDPEINRLLDLLTKHSELNALKDLDRTLQFKAIKVGYKKELLVAMREATEDNNFDAILEDEFYGIQNSLSRSLYLAVCCFYQHGAYARDGLLAKLLNTSLPELYEKTSDSTEGVVIYDCIDENMGLYGARARHRKIAEVVWERCGTESNRADLFQSSLSALNLSYKTDKDSFDCFIQSDRMVDDIRSLEGKIRFFDVACQKDPLNPYARQHYARMLLRESKYDLALLQIDIALQLAPDMIIIHHTRGDIFSKMAFTLDSHEIARRRRIQAEESFRKGLTLYSRNEYCYQGLAKLYIRWATRADTSEVETALYLSKAEEIITEGLRVVRVRDGLWIESSNIQKILGNQPACLKALETAVRDSPGSIFPRLLLGRNYRKEKRFDEAIAILSPVIQDHHEEVRSFVEYALCLLYKGETYANAIAILKLSTLYGLSDPRFIATLGGMCFMNGNFTEAEEVFKRSAERGFTAVELNKIQFRPPNPNSLDIPLYLNGKIVVRKAGYAFIEVAGYPTFFCPGSKFGRLIMETGLEVSFTPAFTPKGPVAHYPRIVDEGEK